MIIVVIPYKSYYTSSTFFSGRLVSYLPSCLCEAVSEFAREFRLSCKSLFIQNLLGLSSHILFHVS